MGGIRAKTTYACRGLYADIQGPGFDSRHLHQFLPTQKNFLARMEESFFDDREGNWCPVEAPPETGHQGLSNGSHLRAAAGANAAGQSLARSPAPSPKLAAILFEIALFCLIFLSFYRRLNTEALQCVYAKTVRETDDHHHSVRFGDHVFVALPDYEDDQCPGPGTKAFDHPASHRKLYQNKQIRGQEDHRKDPSRP